MKKILLLVFILGSTLPAWSQSPADFKRTEDVIYGRKFGTALTMDIFQPAKSNGVGIILVVSGGWFSSHEMIAPSVYKPLLDRGYVLFAVVHGSQPKFTIPEITQDMQRAVRFIRYHAASYGIDPNRLGVAGGSAGGHLSLTLGTHGEKGRADARDPIDRVSSAVQCVACFFPPTDFLNYGAPNQDGVGTGILKDFKPAFGPLSDTPEGRQKLGREISPIYFVSSNMPPTLIIHGNADRLVPIQQSESFVKRSREAGATAELIVREGKGHGWPNWPADLALCADWFDKYLRGIKK
jgi:acetyl esterase/lipase